MLVGSRYIIIIIVVVVFVAVLVVFVILVVLSIKIEFDAAAKWEAGRGSVDGGKTSNCQSGPNPIYLLSLFSSYPIIYPF